MDVVISVKQFPVLAQKLKREREAAEFQRQIDQHWSSPIGQMLAIYERFERAGLGHA